MPASDYTLVNFEQVKDSAAQSADHQARVAKDDLGSEATGVTHHRLEPGARQAVGHRRAVAEEVFVVIAADARLRGRPRGIELLACGPRHDGDAEVVPGWWSE